MEAAPRPRRRLRAHADVVEVLTLAAAGGAHSPNLSNFQETSEKMKSTVFTPQGYSAAQKVMIVSANVGAFRPTSRIRNGVVATNLVAMRAERGSPLPRAKRAAPADTDFRPEGGAPARRGVPEPENDPRERPHGRRLHLAALVARVPAVREPFERDLQETLAEGSLPAATKEEARFARFVPAKDERAMEPAFTDAPVNVWALSFPRQPVAVTESSATEERMRSRRQARSACDQVECGRTAATIPSRAGLTYGPTLMREGNNRRLQRERTP